MMISKKEVIEYLEGRIKNIEEWNLSLPSDQVTRCYYKGKIGELKFVIDWLEGEEDDDTI